MPPARTILRAFAASLFVAALAACAAAPRMPLMSPLDDGGGFGYSEQQLAADRFEVSYLGPRTRSSVRREKRAADTETARNLAYDLALWRAAVLSAQHGFPAFVVDDKQTDVEVEIVNDELYTPFFPGIHRHGLHRSHFDSFHGYGQGFRRVRVQAQATLIVTFLNRPKGGAFDAAATIESLRRKHPGALSVPQN